MHPILRTMLALLSHALLACALLAGGAHASPLRYQAVAFQPIGIGTVVADLNEAGQAVGRTALFDPHLGYARWVRFLSSGDSYTDLGARGIAFEPSSLNDRGQVAGTARDEASGRARAYFHTGSEVREIPSLGGPATVATALNDAGQVAGYASVSGWDYRAFLYRDGVTTTLGSPAGPGHASGAFDINQRGQLAGEWVDEHLHKRAFLYDAGIMRDLGTLGGNAASASHISNAGHVIGLSETAEGVLASFLWFEGSMTALTGPGGAWFGAKGVNSAGDVVGGAGGLAYLRTGEQFYRLDETLGAGAGWALSDAFAINDRGQIAAYGCKDGVGCTAVLLSPVPEAGVASMLLAGMAAGWLWLRRRPQRRPPGPRTCPSRARHPRRAIAALVLPALLAGAAGTAAAAPTPLSFTVTVLADPAGRPYSVADINNLGQRAGTFSAAEGANGHAFLQTGSTLTDLGTLGGWRSRAVDLNNSGAVLGAADAPISGSPRGFIHAGGVMHDLGTLGGDATYPAALNDAGQAVGYARTLAGQEHAFLYSDGRMIDLGTLAAHGDLSYATDINNAGQVTGHWVDQEGYPRAFIYEDGRMRDVGTLGGRWSYGAAIGEAGEIVGIAEALHGQIHAYLRRGGAITDLGAPPDQASQALDINIHGDIIGMAYGGAVGPLIWRDGVMGNLNDYLVPGSGLSILEVGRINDLGQILGTGCHSGVCHQVLLTPVPEPAAALLLCAGLLVLGWRRGALAPVLGWRRGTLALARRLGMPVLALAACGLGGTARAQAPPPVPFPYYHVTTFTMPRDSFPTIAAINNAGQIAGHYIIQGEPAIGTAYLSSGTTLRPLPAVPGSSTWATGANDFGGVVGVAADAGGTGRGERAFFYSGGQMRDLGTLGGSWARPAAVNNAGQVVGMSADAGGQARAFLYTQGRMTDLSALAPGGVALDPLDINQRGDITGSWVIDGEPRAFLYRDGQWRDLGDIGGLDATGRRLNDSGWVTGDAERVDAKHVPFLYTEDGMREITLPNDAFQLIGRGINARGDVVGDGYSDHGPCCAFLSRQGSTVELNSLMEPGSGWSIYHAVDINDHGQIAAYACGNPGCMIVRLDPVPEPATWAMLAAGLAACLWKARRRTGPQRPGPARGRGLLARAGGAEALPARPQSRRALLPAPLHRPRSKSVPALLPRPLAAAVFTSLCAALLMAMLLAPSPARAAAPAAYTITPYPPGGADAYAIEMNARGHMLGYLLRSGGPWSDDGVRSAFLTTGPGFVDIGRVMGSFAPAGLNSLDQVAGTATLGAQGRTRAYLYQDGVVSNLGTLGGNNSGASAINDAGQVAGFSEVAGGTEHAFLYQDGHMLDIAQLGTGSRALDINERGQVAGRYTDAAGHTRAFLYENGAMRDLGTLGGDFALATDIGNGGHVLGTSRDAAGLVHNFIFHAGVMTALADGTQPLRALGINAAGDAVGAAEAPGAGGAWLWSGGQLYDLNAMVSEQWEVRGAVAINDLGQIAATGCLRGSCSAVLLSPIPEPAAAPLLLAGLGLLGVLGWRRRPAGGTGTTGMVCRDAN